MMKNNKKDKKILDTDFSLFTSAELVDAFVFPTDRILTAEEKIEERDFWAGRRKQFGNRTPMQQISANLLQLKFQLDDYIGSEQYQKKLNFGYFLNEYVSLQEKKDKEFANEVDVTPAVLSQYINNHRKPKDGFVIRLEIHSNGLIPAISWFKLIQKDKEQEIMCNLDLRREESKHVKKRLEFAY